MAKVDAIRRNSKTSLSTVNRLLESTKTPPNGTEKIGMLMRRDSSASGLLRRRHTINEGARGAMESSKTQIYEDTDAAKSRRKPTDTVDCMAIQLAIKHRLMLSEVKRIMHELLKVRRDAAGEVGEAEFHKALCRIFDVSELNESITKSAYACCTGGEGINMEELLSWYVQNMFTSVNRLNSDPAKKTSEKLTYDLAKRLEVPPPIVDKLKKKFDDLDLDKSGIIEYGEFQKMFCSILKASSVDELNPERIRRFWNQVKKETDRGINFCEFVEWYFQYFSPDFENDPDFDMLGPLRKFYMSFDPTVRRRNSFTSLVDKGLAAQSLD